MSFLFINKTLRLDNFGSTILAIIFWDFLVFYQIFLNHKWSESWLLVRNMVYTSCLTSCRRTKTYDLRKLGSIKKIWNLDRIITWCPVFLPKWTFCQYKWKTVQKLKSNVSCSALFHTNTNISLIYFGQDCLGKQYFASNSPKAPSNLTCFSHKVTAFKNWNS